MIEIMPINRPDIVKAKLFKQRSAHRHAARKFVSFLGGQMKRVGQFARKPLGKITQLKEWPR